jgi:hypothetical protein
MQARGVVVSGVANLYSRPSTAVDLVTQAIVGTEVAIETSQEGWHHVLLPDCYPGWIEARHVRTHAPDEPAYASSGRAAEVRSLMAFLYHAPDMTARAPDGVATLGARLDESHWSGLYLGARRP